MTLRTIVCTLALAAATAAFAALNAGDPAPAFSAPASLAGRRLDGSIAERSTKPRNVGSASGCWAICIDTCLRLKVR